MTVVDETRDEIIEAIGHVNALAKRTLRKDPIGRENPDWAAWHEELNALLDSLEVAPG